MIKSIVLGALLASGLAVAANAEITCGKNWQDSKHPNVAIYKEMRDDPAIPKLGSPDGCVQVVHVVDFDCPACVDNMSVIDKMFTTPELDKKLSWMFLVFPADDSFAKASIDDARALMAAQLQDKGVEMTVAMQNAAIMNREKGAVLTYDRLVPLAEKIGLDTERFKKDFHSQKVDEMLKRHAYYAKKWKINTVPRYYINDQYLRASQTSDVLLKAIKAELQ